MNDDRFPLLWASDGSEYCLSTAATLRQLLLPAVSRVTVVTVAPLQGGFASLKRLIGRDEREQEVLKAEEAAQLSIEALGAKAPVQRHVRWGACAAEIVKAAAESTNGEATVIAVGARPFNALRSTFLDDTAVAVLKASQRSVLLARPPSGETLSAIVILCASPRWLAKAVDLVGRLRLQDGTKVYLAAFIEPQDEPAGLFFSYREHERQRNEMRTMIDRRLLYGLLRRAADTLAERGYKTEVVIGEGGVNRGLSQLVEDVSGGAVVIGATPSASGSFTTTPEALNAALRAPCSVLVAR